LKEIGLCPLLLLQQEIRMIVKPSGSDLCAGGQLIQPMLAATRAVDIDACHENATRAVAWSVAWSIAWLIDALHPRLRSYDISDQRHMSTGVIP
jgi:hypothetical protein